MSELALAIDCINSAIVHLGSELGTMVHGIGIDAAPTADMAKAINTLAEVVKALSS